MSLIKIDQFHGIAPRQHPTQLADGMAITANNVKLKNGKLVPLREPSKASDVSLMMENGLANIADAKSIHVWKRQDGDFDFMLFPGVTWMADGNIADDKRTRVVVSGATGVKFGDTDDSPQIYMRDNGVKVIHPLCKDALPAPHVTRKSETELTDNKRYTYFFMTWVDKYGYESPVSPQSQIYDDNTGEWVDGDLEYMDGDTINIGAIGSDNVPDEAVLFRVYKVITGTEEGRIQFMKEVSVAATGGGELGFNITVKDEDAGEVLNEIEAPYSDMKCIQDVPGSYYVGFSPTHPKTVCFSDVDLLYSWPVAYQYNVSDNIVAIAVTSNTVFVLTDGWPYVLSGTDPSGMTVTKLAGPASCMSERGVCVYKNAVYYVGQQGLMTIYNDADDGTVCTNLTDKVFIKDQWQAFNPSSCVMGQFDGALHLFFTLSDGTHKGLSIDLTESANSVTTHDEVAKCVCVDNRADAMYYVREGE